MSKLEGIMASLKADQSRRIPPKPQLDMRQRLALALMRADRQVSCTNCTNRYRPCRVHEQCKDEGFSYFAPKQTLMDMQMNRVDAIINEINKL